jgi:uncharacterized protein (DUF924 family)
MLNPRDILDFWFVEAGKKKWYNGGDAFDAEIRTRFEDFSLDAATQLRSRGTHDWENAPEAALALILALDQFPRNMYRGTKGAFAYDALALSVAKRAIDRGFDLKTDQEKRSFFYMPFMHSESIDDQDECVRLCDLCLENPGSLHHAKEHRILIIKFGRFPHRNAILGRENTAKEAAFLQAGGYSP